MCSRTSRNSSRKGHRPLRTRCVLPLILPLYVALGRAAQCQGIPQAEIGVGYDLPYRLDQPLLQARLPHELDEISGLAVLDSARVVAVQDEDGSVFVIDANTGEVRSTHRFGGKGDYEGIEAAADGLYVLRSDGTLFFLQDWNQEQVGRVTRFNTPLSGRYDTEGLALEMEGHSLLIACKEYPGKGLKGKRSVFRFSIDSRVLELQPALILDAEAAEQDVPEDAISRTIRRLLDIRRFKPSGIAVHPISGEIFIVSSVAQSLTVFDSKGTLLGIGKLDRELLPQPEGITFLPNGDLLISTEAHGKRARLVRYRYLQPATELGDVH